MADSKRCLQLLTVDAFTDKPFTGNAAAICLDDTKEGLTEQSMLDISAEMNLSETAFVRCKSPGKNFKTENRFDLRWFTPTVEVPLCGHATLATSAALFKCADNENEVLSYDTKSGVLQARKEAGGRIALDFPQNPTVPFKQDVTELVKHTIGDMKTQDIQHSPTTGKLLVRLHDDLTRSDLELIKPDFERMLQSHDGSTVNGVIVTVKNNDSSIEYDFYSRYFAPWVGLNEDPVCGSAHTVLACYYSEQLGKRKFLARQCSKRGGDLNLQLRDDGRIDLIGSAVVVLSGKLYY